MKKFFSIALVVTTMLAMASSYAAVETNTFSHKNGTFKDMSVDQFLRELGPGYTSDTLASYDPAIRYDPYKSIPVNIDFGLRAKSSDGTEYGWNWAQRLILGESVSVEFPLKYLPNTPKGVRYDHFDLAGGVQSWQDIPMKIQIENAQIKISRQMIELSKANGVFSTIAYGSSPGKQMSWVFGGLRSGSIELPDTKALKKGIFKADVTLLSADGPSKAEFYSDGMREFIPKPTAEWFAFLKSEGYNSIRFQVTWFNHTNDETYRIDDEWLLKVEEVVNLALEQGLYCSINLSWDMSPDYNHFGYSKEELARFPSTHGWLTLDGDPKVEERFATVWSQIAEHFIDYDERLIFESVNEPNGPDSTMTRYGAVSNRGKGWAKLGKIGDHLNRLNQIFVDSVRNTGGNNARRFLLVPPFFHKGVERYLKAFQLPSDPAERTIVAINYYLGDEAIGGGDPFDALEEYLVSQGIGVIITETGSNESEFEYSDRVMHLKATVASANRLHIPIIYYAGQWGTFEQPDAPQFCLYNPFTMEPAFPELIQILLDNHWE